MKRKENTDKYQGIKTSSYFEFHFNVNAFSLTSLKSVSFTLSGVIETCTEITLKSNQARKEKSIN